jgi:hypothetical protein
MHKAHTHSRASPHKLRESFHGRADGRTQRGARARVPRRPGNLYPRGSPGALEGRRRECGASAATTHAPQPTQCVLRLHLPAKTDPPPRALGLERPSQVREALKDNALLEALIAPELPSQLLLDMAAKGERDCCLGALQRGADVNIRNAQGETPLVLAVRAHSEACVSLLLAAGADVHLRTPSGETALHVAAAAGDEQLCLRLIDAGHEPHSADSSGRTPVDLMRADSMEELRVFAHYAERHDARKRAAKRLLAYVDGALPSVCSSVRFFAGDDLRAWSFYAGRAWTERSHRYAPPALREAIFSLLLTSRRRAEGEVCALPRDLWVQIFRCMDRDWIREPGVPHRGQTVQTAQPTQSSGLCVPAQAADALGVSELQRALQAVHVGAHTAEAHAGAASGAAQPERSQRHDELGAVRPPGTAQAHVDPHSASSDASTDALPPPPTGFLTAERMQAAQAIQSQLDTVEESLRLLRSVIVDDPIAEMAVAGPLRSYEEQICQLQREMAAVVRGERLATPLDMMADAD